MRINPNIKKVIRIIENLPKLDRIYCFRKIPLFNVYLIFTGIV